MSLAQDIISRVEKRCPGQPEFYQAISEVVTSLEPLFQREDKYLKYKILDRLVEPDRGVNFRVAWVDDKGEVQVNRATRVQFNNALGPYKGGIRFHPSVNDSIIKFLGFEQTLKNALTGLALGGGKGGSDFDPKGKSEGEIMRFCQAFMTELVRYTGPTIDVPAGDIGVGQREIGYMYGQYKRMTSSHDGVLTGKNVLYGGSLARTEATGYGLVYFAENMLKSIGKGLEGKTCVVSGAGNVAIHCVEKLLELGAKPVTVSDSRGFIHHPQGINLEVLRQVKEVERASLERYAELCPEAKFTPVSDYPQERNLVWSIPCDLALPCATQNELNDKDAEELLKNGCQCVAEGANMPCTEEASNRFIAAQIPYAPSKAGNAGGVATSQLEMAQNASMQKWGFDEVDNKLKVIMSGIFELAHETAKEFGQETNLVLGANIAGFRRVADTMIALGVY